MKILNRSKKLPEKQILKSRKNAYVQQQISKYLRFISSRLWYSGPNSSLKAVLRNTV